MSSGSQLILLQTSLSYAPREENEAENEFWYAFPMQSDGTVKERNMESDASS
jgi:hypothetical protein